MCENIKLTRRELEVMNVLWESSTPIAAKDIIEIKPSLPMNTVQWALKTLLKKNYIEVTGVTYSNRVLTRCYLPKISSDEYILHSLTQNNNNINYTIDGILAAFLKDKSDEQTIENLEMLLQEYRNKFGKKHE